MVQSAGVCPGPGFHYVAPVTSPDERADSGARNAAIKVVEDALKSGRIVAADHDMRIDQLRRARTMQEVDLLVRDLRGSVPAAPVGLPPGPMVGVGQQPWPQVNYGPAAPGSLESASAVSKGGKVIGGLVGLALLVALVVPVIGVAIAFFAARDAFPDFADLGPTDETTYLPGQAPGPDGVNVHTVEGFEDLVGALREVKGDTFTFTAVLYPRYAVLELPTGVNQRYESYFWDGRELKPNDIRSTSSDEQLDLSLVEPEQLIDMLTTVRDRMDAPTSWYVVISDSPDSQTQVTAYASNDFGESTYLMETLDGTVVYDSDAAAAAAS